MLRQFLIISIIFLASWLCNSMNRQRLESQMVATSTAYWRPADVPNPIDNRYTKEKFELGRSLFFDPLMSGSNDISCATCHNPQLSWSDGRPRAVGAAHKPLPVRTPTLLNIAWQAPLGWDGKFASLEAVAFGPLMAKSNMNMTEALLVERLTASPKYVALFRAAFEDGIASRNNIEKALATYERTIVSGDAPFDRWAKGDKEAITPAAQRGFTLFNTKAQCYQCHSGWAFTDGGFHDIGTAKGDDIGRGRYFPNSKKLRYAFKTPTLRDVAKRSPYMHDGAVPTLEKVIALYDAGGIERPSRAAAIKPLGLTESEISDLIAFLKTLSSD